jgi:hypothetical protein
MDKIRIPIMHQDCTSMKTLATKGDGITRTKSLRVRMNLGRRDRIAVEYYENGEDESGWV